MKIVPILHNTTPITQALVARTAKARRALKQDRRNYQPTGNGYYLIDVTLRETQQMQSGELTRLQLLHKIGVY